VEEGFDFALFFRMKSLLLRRLSFVSTKLLNLASDLLRNTKARLFQAGLSFFVPGAGVVPIAIGTAWRLIHWCLIPIAIGTARLPITRNQFLRHFGILCKIADINFALHLLDVRFNLSRNSNIQIVYFEKQFPVIIFCRVT
jgi:hypothetical protein